MLSQLLVVEVARFCHALVSYVAVERPLMDGQLCRLQGLEIAFRYPVCLQVMDWLPDDFVLPRPHLFEVEILLLVESI